MACDHVEHLYVRTQMRKIDELLQMIDKLSETLPFTHEHYSRYKIYIDKVSLFANLIPDLKLNNDCCRNQMSMAKGRADTASHKFICALYKAERLGKSLPHGWALFIPEA